MFGIPVLDWTTYAAGLAVILGLGYALYQLQVWIQKFKGEGEKP
jgi:hypothetical protein